eukprot:2856804-Amphidinium_carterae.1
MEDNRALTHRDSLMCQARGRPPYRQAVLIGNRLNFAGTTAGAPFGYHEDEYELEVRNEAMLGIFLVIHLCYLRLCRMTSSQNRRTIFDHVDHSGCPKAQQRKRSTTTTMLFGSSIDSMVWNWNAVASRKQEADTK